MFSVICVNNFVTSTISQQCQTSNKTLWFHPLSTNLSKNKKHLFCFLTWEMLFVNLKKFFVILNFPSVFCHRSKHIILTAYFITIKSCNHISNHYSLYCTKVFYNNITQMINIKEILITQQSLHHHSIFHWR